MLNRREALRRACASAVALSGANWIFGTGGLTSVSAAEDDKLSVDVLKRGSSSLLQIRNAKSSVPTGRLNPADRKLVDLVLDDTSIYRRLPEVRCETDPRVLEFFLDHPDVAVSVWRAMGVSELKLSEAGPNYYHADGGDGSVGKLKVMLKEPDQRVVFCDGQFVNPVASKPISARCVIHFQNQYERSRSGQTFARHSATMFVSLPQSAIETAARVISPVSNRIADKNFEEVSLFVRMMSVAMSSRLGWCEQVARRLDGLPATKQRGFLDLAAAVHKDAGVVQTAARS